jgi:hypothetical protein
VEITERRLLCFVTAPSKRRASLLLSRGNLFHKEEKQFLVLRFVEFFHGDKHRLALK